MFTVYAKPYGQRRRVLGHFKDATAAQEFSRAHFDAVVEDEVSIIEEPDGDRTNFVDAPDQPTPTTAALTPDTIPVERMAKPEKGE